MLSLLSHSGESIVIIIISIISGHYDLPARPTLNFQGLTFGGVNFLATALLEENIGLSEVHAQPRRA